MNYCPILEPVLIEDVDPSEEPVTVAEARAQCEAPAYEDSDVDPIDDAMFAIWIAAARQHCEEFLGLSLAPRVYQVNAHAFPGGYQGGYAESYTYTGAGWPYTIRRQGPYSGGIELTRGPVRWASIDYGDESDALTLEQDIGFSIDRFRTPNRLVPIGAWPSVDVSGSDAVRITYGAGYGVNSDANYPVPPAAKVAILGMVGYLFENRGNSVDLVEIPKFVEVLLRPLRVRIGMA
jgi:hypothetical protein